MKLRFYLNELIGALGDIGTLLPLMVALVAVNGINPLSALLGTGLLYLATGWYYRIPLPVQPLKALAAIAIVTQAAPQVIAAGALWIALILFILSYFNLGPLLNRIFTKPIVRGIQFGIGLILIKECVLFIADSGLSLVPLDKLLANAQSSISGFSLSLPSWDNLAAAFILLVIPQLPLTIGNSLVASEDAARYYYGEKANKVKIRNLSISLALGNLWAGLTMGLPVCHGSGGITAHYKFGARSGYATIFFGLALIILTLTAGVGIIRWFGAIPLPILGLMLGYVGIAHCLLMRSLRTEKVAFALAFAIGFIGAITTNLSIAFIAGICLTYLGRLASWALPERAQLPKNNT